MRMKEKSHLSFPYIPAVFNPLCRLGRKIGTQLVAQKACSLKAHLCSRVKNRLPQDQESGVVYRIDCSCGCRYTGESDREVWTRVSEHKKDHEKRRQGKSFSHHLDHQPNFDGYSVIAHEPREDLRRLQEAIFIVKDQGRNIQTQSEWTTNKNLGRDYSPVWEEVVERVTL